MAVIKLNLIDVNDHYPEEDFLSLIVITKSGLKTIATYWADEDGDCWKALDPEYAHQDPFFTIDPIKYWADVEEASFI